jgi:hypothetical protein
MEDIRDIVKLQRRWGRLSLQSAYPGGQARKVEEKLKFFNTKWRRSNGTHIDRDLSRRVHGLAKARVPL